MKANGTPSRPGISAEFLARNNVRHVGLHSSELIVNDRPFWRVRLDYANGAKYPSPRGSGVQLYMLQGPPFGRLACKLANEDQSRE